MISETNNFTLKHTGCYTRMYNMIVSRDTRAV
jgi:hypothetical protein